MSDCYIVDLKYLSVDFGGCIHNYVAVAAAAFVDAKQCAVVAATKACYTGHQTLALALLVDHEFVDCSQGFFSLNPT